MHEHIAADLPSSMDLKPSGRATLARAAGYRAGRRFLLLSAISILFQIIVSIFSSFICVPKPP